MVIDPQDPNSRSAGSFFKNPIVEKKVYEAIQAKALKAVPHFPFDEEMIKIPAAWLIENSGFHKGFRMGGAGLSERHPLAIVNASGDADVREIVALKNAIQAAVLDKFAIRLDPEPIFVGFD
jgi:UDP-N-acetylmuramate dehydrogenase